MVTWAVEPLKSTIVEGTIVERLVLLVGILLFAYGLVQFVPVGSGLVSNFTSSSAEPILTETLVSFFGITVGLVVVVLAVALDFRWSAH